jgi:SAM-dependent methyltransferase
VTKGGIAKEPMSQETSGVGSSFNPAAGGQPVWDEERAAWWLANADARERQLQPVSDALFERASLQPGERVLDVGVGSGPTTGQAWEAVRPDGSVTGIDIAPPMIAAARQRITAPEIEWIVGDAAVRTEPYTRYHHRIKPTAAGRSDNQNRHLALADHPTTASTSSTPAAPTPGRFTIRTSKLAHRKPATSGSSFEVG